MLLHENIYIRVKLCIADYFCLFIRLRQCMHVVGVTGKPGKLISRHRGDIHERMKVIRTNNELLFAGKHRISRSLMIGKILLTLFALRVLSSALCNRKLVFCTRSEFILKIDSFYERSKCGRGIFIEELYQHYDFKCLESIKKSLKALGVSLVNVNPNS